MKDDRTTGIKVALLIMLVTFGYLFAVTFLTMPETGAEQAKTIVPFLLGTVIGTLVGFYYGNKHEQQPPVASPIDETAKAAAAENESKRIEAAKAEAAVIETARIEAAKVEAAKVIETVKTEVKP